MYVNRYFRFFLFLAGALVVMMSATASRADILERLGGLDTPGPATQIHAEGTYAYVGDFYQGFRVIDVTNSRLPFEVTADSSQTVDGFAVAGGYAYLAGSYLRIMNLADPKNPVQVGTWDGYGYGHPSAVAVAGNTAYTTSTNFDVLNVTNKAAPTFVGTCRLLSQGKDLVLNGTYAYVREDRGIEIVSFADPEHPAVVGYYDFSIEDSDQYTGSLFYKDGYLYVTLQNSAKSFRVLSLANPVSPAEVGSLRIEESALNDVSYGVVVVGTQAYVGAASEGLKVIDVSDVTKPAVLISSTEADFNCKDVYPVGDLIYVTDNHGMAIFQVSSRPAGDVAPTIELVPTDGYMFQASVLDGDGFAVRIQDDNGIRNDDGSWHVDLGTLKVFVDGVDRTVRFVDTLLKNKIVRLTEEGIYDLELAVKPDPKKFMAEHDMFYILENGKHRIEFKICDRTGLCGRSDDFIYYGPFGFVVGPVTDQFAMTIVFGNMGYATPTKAYFLLKTDKGYMSNTGSWDDGIRPLVTLPLPSGMFGTYNKGLSLIGLDESQQEKLTSYRFLLGMMDSQTGAYTLDSQPIVKTE